MGLCLHTVALFKDLKGSLIKVDEEMSEETEFKSAMNPLIDYHNQILALMEEIQSAFSGIFFTQFVGTIFILCSQSYLGSMVSEVHLCSDNLQIMVTYSFLLLESGKY